MTLVELLVALVVSLIVVLAAVTSLTVARRGFNTVDAASQLRDNGRFAADLLQRIGVQTGQLDSYYATSKCTSGMAECPPAVDATALISPNVLGVDNAIPSPTDPVNNSTVRTSGTLGYGSDVLVLRYQMNRMYHDNPDSNLLDGTMIDCHGGTPPSAIPPIDRNDRVYGVLYVSVGISGEPALMCYRAGASVPAPLVDGVENFQVLYGVDGVTPNSAPVLTTDSVPERYLPASKLTVIGDTVATAANWRRVRSIRIGMVLRGPIGSAQNQTSETLYPLGIAKDSPGGTAGSAFSSTTDIGTIFTPPNDGRLRQVVNFTIHLRNFQGSGT